MLSKCNVIDDLTHYIKNNKYFLDKRRLIIRRIVFKLFYIFGFLNSVILCLKTRMTLNEEFLFAQPDITQNDEMAKFLSNYISYQITQSAK